MDSLLKDFSFVDYFVKYLFDVFKVWVIRWVNYYRWLKIFYMGLNISFICYRYFELFNLSLYYL